MTTTSAPDPPPPSRQFDFLLGEWRCDGARYKPDGSILVAYQAAWSAKAVDDGRMIVDEFKAVSPEGRPLFFVVTLRTYCEATGRWELAALGAQQPAAAISDFHGVWRDGEMRLEALSRLPNGATAQARIRFFDIAADRFDWENDYSLDGGATWLKAGAFRATRV